MKEKQPQAGDKVKISTVKEEIEGTLLESYEPGIILIKLKSGYNIGIKKEDVVLLEREPVLSQKESKAPELKKIKQNPKLPNVDIIMTGGTISSRLDAETGAVKWLTSPEELLKFYPELLEICNIRKIKVPFMKASENMDYLDWQEIAKNCEESLNDKEISGVIITHGTDFLHYTSSALSFFLRDLNKPVVLTYAQRSSDRASSDAALNLQCAARAAISEIAEVMIVGHSGTNDDFCYALLGSKVKKLHSSRRDAFKPVNCKPIAKIFLDRIETITQFKRRNDGKVKLDLSFNNKIALIKFYPGMEPEIFEFLSGRYEGIVLELVGLGHLAIDEARRNLLAAIKKAIDNGMIVCAASQTIYGRLDPLVYSPGRKLIKTGIIFLEDMLAETAYVKLGFVLGKAKEQEKIKKLMLTNIAGELNSRLEE
ncbi:Glu-tRNA(Gln) amidotransferase subunit GatD [Candidatus Pacearchaeota archaeon]|nr:Glu-tRNA(Gln) amidotransferase subunit GatD [Candidatus Pacearchaeota archaeon]